MMMIHMAEIQGDIEDNIDISGVVNYFYNKNQSLKFSQDEYNVLEACQNITFSILSRYI